MWSVVTIVGHFGIVLCFLFCPFTLMASNSNSLSFPKPVIYEKIVKNLCSNHCYRKKIKYNNFCNGPVISDDENIFWTTISMNSENFLIRYMVFWYTAHLPRTQKRWPLIYSTATKYTVHSCFTLPKNKRSSQRYNRPHSLSIYVIWKWTEVRTLICISNPLNV